MSYYTVGDLFKDVTRKLKGGAASQSLDFYGAVDEGRREFLKEIDPVELQRTSLIEQAIYDQVNKYAVPEDLNYDNLSDLRLLAGYRNVDTLQNPIQVVYNKRFDQKRRSAKNVVSIVYENGVKYLKMFNPNGLRKATQMQIHDANSLTQNGTWNVGGNLTDLVEDKLTFIAGTGSLRFNINTSSTNGNIENTTLKPVDMTEYLANGVGAVFTWLDIDLPRELLAVQITLESSPGNSYQYTVNRAHDNTSFIKGWNLLKFPLDGITVNGTPNPRMITGVRFDFTTAGNQPMYKCHIDNIVLRKGVVYQVTYQTSYCFIDPVTMAWKKIADSKADIIPLEEDAYQLLMLSVALVLQKDAFSNSVGKKSDIKDIEDDLSAAFKMYRMDHKSERIPRQDSSYIFGNIYDGYVDDPMTGIPFEGDNVRNENETNENPDDSYGLI